MGFSAHNDLLDNGPQYLKDQCTLVTVCNAEPTTYALASDDEPTGYKLADVVVSSTDFTVADGDVSGRKVTMAQKTGVNVDRTGTATHVAFCNSAGSKLLMVKPCTSQGLTQGNSITIPANKWEVKDPVAA